MYRMCCIVIYNGGQSTTRPDTHPVQELSPLQVLQKSGNYSTKSTGKSSMIINPVRTELDPARPIAPRSPPGSNVTETVCSPSFEADSAGD